MIVRRSLAILLLLAGLGGLGPALAGEADASLRALYESEWTWRQNEFARGEQDERGRLPASRLPDVTPEAYARRLEYWDEVLEQLDAIPLERLSHEERINAEVFRTSIRALAANARYRTYEAPFNSDSFFWGGLAPRQPFGRAEAYRRHLSRMRDIPRHFDEQIANMRAGLARGYSVPRVSIERRDATIEPYTVADASNPFHRAFAQMPGHIPAEEREALTAEAEAVIRDSVVPAYTRLLAFMRDEYMPQTRTTTSARALPDGEAYYLAQIREYTTLDLAPEAIHAIGLEEVARISEEMRTTMRRTGFEGDFDQFLAFLRSDPQFYAQTPRELLSFAAYVAKRVDGRLDDAFGLLPRHRFTILPVPDEIAPIYTSGRGGLDACLFNTYDLPSRPLYNLTALVLHECSPGHSFQAALAREAPERPAFRQQTYFSGYGEGWGLYVEWLGTLMGIYETPYDEFGRLTFEMWRAARLVIDTGLHHYDWTREQAIDYLARHTALAQHDIETEVDRYISWPGQALAYKLGELTLRRLRAEAEAELGPAFDQRPFHDAILALGSVPLPVLEAEIGRFIAEQKLAAKDGDGRGTGVSGG